MKFKVAVTLNVEKTYSFEVESSKESKAEDLAMDKAIEAFRSDFNSKLDLYDTTEFLTEKITSECEECGTEYVVDSPEAWFEDNDFCAQCGAKILEEEKTKGAQA
jgi:hypothetical protein